jgi:glycosyltransferase involved in cell wall biosynthesis
MLFSFLKYVRPVWYLNMRPIPPNVFVNYDLLLEEEKELIDYCKEYVDPLAPEIDAALQAWFKGFIERGGGRCLRETECCTNVYDNYLFMRRFFSPFWSWYTLFLRLFSLHNPVLELKAFWRHRRIKRLDLFAKTKSYPELDNLRVDNSGTRFVSVIIPTLNRYTYLKDVLHDLERQEYRSFEVIVVDQSDPFDAEFYEQFSLDLQVVRQEEKALWKARNDAIRRARGELILVCDDDSRVKPDWITRHLECLDYFNADLSSGVSFSVVGDKIPKAYSYYKWSDQVDTGNVMVKRAVFEKVGLFDRQFEKQRMGDAEFGMRCYLAGLRNVSNPNASRVHLKVGEGGLREMGSWDAFRPRGFFRPRPVPSVLYYVRKYFGTRAALLALIKDVPASIVPYKYKGSRLMRLLGFVAGLILMPMVILQVIASWKQSTLKLEGGDRIDYLRS